MPGGLAGRHWGLYYPALSDRVEIHKGLPELWVTCADRHPIKVRGATDAMMDWGWCVNKAQIVVADIGQGGIIGMGALHL